MHGCVPLGGVHLHVLAFDLARCADGLWWVVGQRTQAPSGLGYVLENRLIIAEQFPEAFRDMSVQRLASSFQTLLQGLMRLSPEGDRARVALLTPGPRNETYFEHTFLARYLGITLVEGGDLTVREDKVYLKTTLGLERVHVLLRRVDDDYLDPLELRSDSALGVPGLLQAMRAGEVVVANTPGSGCWKAPASRPSGPASPRPCWTRNCCCRTPMPGGAARTRPGRNTARRWTNSSSRRPFRAARPRAASRRRWSPACRRRHAMR